MDFNIQQYLAEMREEQNQRHDQLAAKMDAMLVIQHVDDKRITILEEAYQAVKWAVGTAVVSFLAFVSEFVYNRFLKQ